VFSGEICEICGAPAARFMFGRFICDGEGCLGRSRLLRGGPAGHRRREFSDFEECEGYLDRCGLFSIKPGLERIKYLCRMLDGCGREPEIIHVAGTNGKGTTAAMAAAILSGHGVRTGLYLSPHVVSVRERISVDGRWIPEEEFCRIMNLMAPHFTLMGTDPALGHPSYFEILTAVALRYFSDAGARAAVLEVGLGGRWDATNCVTSGIAVITNIGLDHTRHLGDTRREIAAEKAGIIKPGTRSVISGIGPDDEVFPVIEERTLPGVYRDMDHPNRYSDRDIGPPDSGSRNVMEKPLLQTIDRDIFFDGGHRDFAVYCPMGEFRGLGLQMPGDHFLHNASLAVTAAASLLESMNIEPGEGSIRNALREFSMVGRMQVIERSIEGRPFLFILDGAHNPDALRALRSAIPVSTGGLSTVVFGMMKDKKMPAMLAALAEFGPRELIFCSCRHERAAPSGDLKENADRCRETVRDSKDGGERVGMFAGTGLIDGGGVPAALEMAVKVTPGGGTILICGSFYVVGEALEMLGAGETGKIGMM